MVSRRGSGAILGPDHNWNMDETSVAQAAGGPDSDLTEVMN